MSSASEHVLNMARAHYGRNEQAFALAVGKLAQQSKSAQLRASLESIVRRGMETARRTPDAPRSLAPLLPEPEASGALYLLPEVSFDELLVADHLRSQLDEIVTELEHASALHERGLRAANRLLFHGPPGNGKTSHASALANALGCQAYCVSIPDLIDSHLGASAKNLASVFASVRVGTVVVFDEMDAIGGSRTDGDGDGAAGREMNSVVNSMLQLLDRHTAGVIVATTNRPDILDSALRRRFDADLLFPEPSTEQLRRLARKLCEQFRIDPASVDVDDCPNFDACTKHVHAAAKRQVMAEIRSAKGETRGKKDEDRYQRSAAE